MFCTVYSKIVTEILAVNVGEGRVIVRRIRNDRWDSKVIKNL